MLPAPVEILALRSPLDGHGRANRSTSRSQRERDRVFALPDLAYESTTRQKKDAQTLTSMPERIVVAALGIVSVKSLFSVCLAQRMGRPLIRLAPERVSSVPILMYHRIAADGPVALERFRVAPSFSPSKWRPCTAPVTGQSVWGLDPRHGATQTAAW